MVAIMAFVGWARVSTQDQDLSIQLETLKSAGCTKIFQGKHSGTSDKNKSELEKLLDYVREGDTVVCTKMDRLGRSLSQVLTILEQLNNKGVRVKFIDQNLDTNLDDPMNKAFVQLLGMFAELERNFIVSRTQEGRKAKGKLGGRPRKLSEEQVQSIKQALVNKTSSQSKLAEKYKVSRATIIGISKQIADVTQ